VACGGRDKEDAHSIVPPTLIVLSLSLSEKHFKPAA
jgi:hypothetical protein